MTAKGAPAFSTAPSTQAVAVLVFERGSPRGAGASRPNIVKAIDTMPRYVQPALNPCVATRWPNPIGTRNPPSAASVSMRPDAAGTSASVMRPGYIAGTLNHGVSPTIVI